MDTAKFRATYAEFDLRKASDAALQAFTLMCAGNHADHYLEVMNHHFVKAADMLGYDLVKRTTATEAAALFNPEAAQ